jgi:DnaD/phage-associated family protein
MKRYVNRHIVFFFTFYGIFLALEEKSERKVFFMPRFHFSPGFVPVSSYFIEQIMPSCNATFVKVYLYAFHLAVQGKEVENSQIASALNLLESDVMHAFSYLYEKGCIEFKDNVVLFTSQKAPAPAVVPASATLPVTPPVVPAATQPSAPAPRSSYRDIASLISANKNLSEMCMLAQNVLGKTLNSSDLETLYWFYDGLHFSPEVILMLLEYCVSKDKRSMKYIEKVAISWHERHITTIEEVEHFMEDEEHRDHYFYSLKKIFGIHNRDLTKTEENYLTAWLNDYQMSEEMVALAYEYCILQTNKLSFPYMDSIIRRWHKQNITTIQAAETDNEQFKAKNNKKTNTSQDPEIYSDPYDHEELERIWWEKLKKEE